MLESDSEKKLEKTKRNYAISLLAIQTETFSGLTFSGIVNNLVSDKIKTSISTNSTENIPRGSSAYLKIPSSIFNETSITNSSKQQLVIFIIYKETKFFSVSLPDKNDTSSRLNSVVISGRFKGLHIANLSDPVEIVLQSIQPGVTNSTLCSYWDFALKNWSQKGCGIERILKDGRTVCNCDHFTNFAILMVSFRAKWLGWSVKILTVTQPKKNSVMICVKKYMQ